MISSEEWRPIPGYEGRYEASSLGQIRSLDILDGRGIFHRGRLLSQQTSHNGGYFTVNLKRGDGGKTLTVHRLVARSFLGEPTPPARDVCHGDGDKRNNRVSNLRWGTRSENAIDRVEAGQYRNQNTGKTHCLRGHEFTSSNTYYHESIGANGRVKRGRHCRECSRIRLAGYRASR